MTSKPAIQTIFKDVIERDNEDDIDKESNRIKLKKKKTSRTRD